MSTRKTITPRASSELHRAAEAALRNEERRWLWRVRQARLLADASDQYLLNLTRRQNAAGICPDCGEYLQRVRLPYEGSVHVLRVCTCGHVEEEQPGIEYLMENAR
ncbi:MAG TPA: hypothetical protein ENI96_09970 [Sedimenticola thiotaurini]|uniref:Uncharacterized protein n=1 Tax=Sedimenticola thiotaurini TaxID=1543721 RepID=A0A831W9B4_9GAMM|nr:hypothetical protein [Sedimenticola thiotaurini]